MMLARMSDVVAMLHPDSQLAKFDISDAFLALPVREDQCELLGFRHPTSGEYYVYRYLAFGVSVSPYLFMCVMKEMQRVLASHGVSPAEPYLDDWLLSRQDKADLTDQMQKFRAIMGPTGVGFRLSEAKTEGPTRSLVYLGIGLDTERRIIYLTDRKRDKAIRLISEVLALPRNASTGSAVWSLQRTQSVAGFLLHIAQVVVGGSSFLGNAWLDIGRAQVEAGWAARSGHASRARGSAPTVELRAETLADFEWWLQAVQANPVRQLFIADSGRLCLWDKRAVPDPWRPPAFCIVLTMDASSVGWGFWFVTAEGVLKRHAGLWTEEQSHNSSNWRELKTVPKSLAKAAKVLELAGRPVLIRSDNAVTVAYVNKGHGRSGALMSLVHELRSLQFRFQTEVTAVHVAGDRNDDADFLSRAGTGLYCQRRLVSSLIKGLECTLRALVGGVALVGVEHAREAVVVVDSDAAFEREHWGRASEGEGWVLWCPGPHQVARTIKHIWSRMHRETHVLLVPYSPHANWWRMIDRTSLVQRWDANTRLFANSPSLTLDNVETGALTLPRKISVPWVAVRF
jgi:hypothetical protein